MTVRHARWGPAGTRSIATRARTERRQAAAYISARLYQDLCAQDPEDERLWNRRARYGAPPDAPRRGHVQAITNRVVLVLGLQPPTTGVRQAVQYIVRISGLAGRGESAAAIPLRQDVALRVVGVGEAELRLPVQVEAGFGSQSVERIVRRLPVAAVGQLERGRVPAGSYVERSVPPCASVICISRPKTS
jgi:hypothetical protein